MLSDECVNGLGFDKYVSRKSGKVIKAVFWDGKKSTFYDKDLNNLPNATWADKGYSKMADQDHTKDGQYCLVFYNTDIDDDTDYIPFLKDSCEQTLEANAGYVMIGTQWFDWQDPIPVPKRIFKKYFRPVHYKYLNLDEAETDLDLGRKISRPDLNGFMFKPKELSFKDSKGTVHKVQTSILLKKYNSPVYKIVDPFFLDPTKHCYYVVK